MPKKQAKNAYWYFMCDWKMREESQGRKFPNGFGDVQRDAGCNEAWKALTPEQKAYYTNRAKQGKVELQVPKRAGTGESIEIIKQQEAKDQDFKHNMRAHIRHTITDAKKYDAIPSLKFIFLHMNHYYERQPDYGDVDYCPAEFAIAEFSLEEGVTRYYHEIIRTPIFPGYTLTAMETSEKSHKLRWDLPIAEGDWSVIYDKTLKFLQPNMIHGKPPPIYTRSGMLHVIPSLLRRMNESVANGIADEFLIYPVEELFSTLLRASDKFVESNVVTAIAETEFKKERFAFTSDIECDYHKAHDGTGQFCSLSIVRQWAFTFCDVCNHRLNLPTVPGTHCPATKEMIMKSIKCKNNEIGSSYSRYSPSVLSATGVSEQHRLAVSERNREQDRRRRNTTKSFEIIDHSKFAKDEKPSKRSPSPPVAVAVAVAPPPIRPLRAPATASQALFGAERDVPKFDTDNFPTIGGRKTSIKPEKTTRRPAPAIWNHRGRKNPDDDSD